MNNEYLQRATDATTLDVRATCNEQYGQKDLNRWILGLANIQRNERILDVGCGTGKQLIAYAHTLDGTGEIVGLDVSCDALETIAQQTGLQRFNIRLVTGPMEDILDLLPQDRKYFHMISCCYSLYYSKDVVKTLRDLKQLLKDGGRLLIVGPGSKNNGEFYELLKRFTSQLPPEISYTNNLMSDVVIPECRKMFARVRSSQFTNPISYPTAEALLEYWHATNYYDNQIEARIAQALQEQFRSKLTFTITKRVMGVLAY